MGGAELFLQRGVFDAQAPNALRFVAGPSADVHRETLLAALGLSSRGRFGPLTTLHSTQQDRPAALVGCGIGVPMALLTGRVRSGEPTQAEALGGVLLCGGVALFLDVSFLLAAMTMGVVVANLARHHRRPFREIEGIEWPSMVLFFVSRWAGLATTGGSRCQPVSQYLGTGCALHGGSACPGRRPGGPGPGGGHARSL